MGNALKWGLIIGFAHLIWFCLEYACGLQTRYIPYQVFSSNLIFFLSAIFVVKGILERKRELGGKISYRRSLAAGTSISLVAAGSIPVILWINTQLINVDFFPALIRYSVSVGKYADDADAASQLNLENFIFQDLLKIPAMGLITSFVSGFFIRAR